MTGAHSLKPAEIAAVVRTMQQRMPWTVAQKALASAGLPRGRGWEASIGKLCAPGELQPQQIDAARQLLVEHEVCGEKLVRVYRLDASTKDALLAQLRSLDLEENVFTRCYPAALSPQEVEDNFPHEPAPAAIVEFETGLAVVFAATKGLILREEVDQEALPPAAREALAGYDEVLGIKQEKRQTFDVVFVALDGDLVEVRVDFPDGMLRGAAQAAHAQVRHAFNALIGYDALQEAKNLFPLLNDMYHAPSEGTVVELAFGTTTASTKYEKMRRQHLCLREEIYHQAGKKALEAQIEPFKLSIQWSVPLAGEVSSRPELSFQSTQRVQNSEKPVLVDAVVRNAIGCRDYDHVRSRLEHFLAKVSVAAGPEPTDDTSRGT